MDVNGTFNVSGVSTVTKLDVSGDFNVSGASTLTNLTISGTITDNLDTTGASGQVLSTTGVGVTWTNVGDLSAGSASKVVLSAQNTTDASRYVTFADGATGANVIYTDTGLRYNPSTNTLTATTFSGNASSATILATARTIGGVSFDGSANINLPGVNAAGNQNTTGTSGGLTGTPSITVQDVTAETVSIAGTLTYEDVTNIDSLGIVTARTGVRVTAGGIDVTAGISTFRQGINVIGLTYTNGDVTFNGDAYNALWDKDTSKLKFYDLAQATFGDGNDLQIYSDGTYGIIKGNDKTKITGITSVTADKFYGKGQLDQLNVTGVSTFAGIGTFGGDVFIDGNVRIVGVLTVGSDSVTIDGNNLNITGVSTIASLAVSAGATAKDLNVTGITTLTTLKIGNSIGITTILDEDDLSSDSAAALASQQSIKAYVDSQVTAQDLDFSGDSGTGAVDLDSQTFAVSGTASEIETSASGQTITVGLPDNVIVGSALTVTNNFKIGGSATVGINTILDEDSFASNSATALVTQQSIKAYVDSNLTDQDLDFVGGTGNGSVDLDSQSFTISGTNNEIETSASGTTLTIGLPDNVNIAGNLDVAGNITGTLNQTVFSGVTTVSDVTEAANSTTGALVVSGGIGVAKNVVVGGGLTVTGDVSIGGTLTYEDVTNIDSVGFVTAGKGVRVTAGGIVVTCLLYTSPSPRDRG